MKHKKTACIVTVIVIAIMIAAALNKGDLSQISSVENLGRELGFISLMPTLLAITLAFITNNVIVSLLTGFLSGVLLLALVCSETITGVPILFFDKAFLCIKEVVFDIDNIKIAIMCVLLGGMMNVAKLSGGYKALAVKLKGALNSPRKAGLFGTILGCLIFFDDYANSLAVGPIMKPIMHQVKLSREKLAMIINGTSAPVAGIAVISSWVAIEISSIQKGFAIIGESENCFSLLIQSLPYCFYCFFIIIFLFLNSLLARDFGTMLRVEQHNRETEKTVIVKEESESNEILNKRISVGMGSIILLVFITLLSFYFLGEKQAVMAGVITSDEPFSLKKILNAISYADTMSIISVASIVSTLFAIVFGCGFGLFTFKESIRAFGEGARKLIGTVVMLLLAWCLADTVKRLGATHYAVDIISVNVSYQFIPALIFICCCIIAFASGSFGCMYTVMPLAIPLAFRVAAQGTVNPERYILLCIGAVISGAVFGDNCSPIADCTILSAECAGIETINHVNTQLPYVLSVCAITILCFVMASIGIKTGLIWLIAIGLETAILLLVGRKIA